MKTNKMNSLSIISLDYMTVLNESIGGLSKIFKDEDNLFNPDIYTEKLPHILKMIEYTEGKLVYLKHLLKDFAALSISIQTAEYRNCKSFIHQIGDWRSLVNGDINNILGSVNKDDSNYLSEIDAISVQSGDSSEEYVSIPKLTVIDDLDQYSCVNILERLQSNGCEDTQKIIMSVQSNMQKIEDLINTHLVFLIDYREKIKSPEFIEAVQMQDLQYIEAFKNNFSVYKTLFISINSTFSDLYRGCLAVVTNGEVYSKAINIFTDKFTAVKTAASNESDTTLELF